MFVEENMNFLYEILTGIGFLLIPFGLYQISNKHSIEYAKKFKQGIYISGIGFILFLVGLVKATQPDFHISVILIMFGILLSLYFNPYFFSKRIKEQREELDVKSLNQNLTKEEQRSHDFFNSERYYYDFGKKVLSVGLSLFILEILILLLR